MFQFHTSVFNILKNITPLTFRYEAGVYAKQDLAQVLVQRAGVDFPSSIQEMIRIPQSIWKSSFC